MWYVVTDRGVFTEGEGTNETGPPPRRLKNVDEEFPPKLLIEKTKKIQLSYEIICGNKQGGVFTERSERDPPEG